MVAVRVESQSKIIRDLRRNVLEANAGAGDALESDPIEGQAWQLADFNFPLHKGVRVRVSVDAQENESERRAGHRLARDTIEESVCRLLTVPSARSRSCSCRARTGSRP